MKIKEECRTKYSLTGYGNFGSIPHMSTGDRVLIRDKGDGIFTLHCPKLIRPDSEFVPQRVMHLRHPSPEHLY